MPRPDAAALVHDALQLSKYCPGSQRPSEQPSPSAAAIAKPAARRHGGGWASASSTARPALTASTHLSHLHSSAASVAQS